MVELTKEQQQGIIDAIDEIDSGKGIPHENVMENIRMKYPLIDSISAIEHDSIQRGIDDSANGRVTPHSEVRNRYKKWL